MKYRSYLFFSAVISSLFGENAREIYSFHEIIANNQEEVFSKDVLINSTDIYLEGYVQALLDIHYCEFLLKVVCKDHVIYLYNLPKNQMLRHSILSFVKGIPGVEEAKEVHSQADEKWKKEEEKKHIAGVWFPQGTVLFQPLIADPREPIYSGSYRAGDDIVGNKVAAVSFGDDFPIFRWRNVFPWHGDLQIGIQAGVWSVFKMGKTRAGWHDFSELFNTDYLVGLPLTYAFDRFSFRLRVYHMSSHLGDEFLVDHRGFYRKNPSMEAVDLYTAYQVSNALRVYLGPGYVFHSDESYKIKPLYVGWGAELRLFGKNFDFHRLYGTPFLAIFLRNWEENSWELDGNYMIGYEWSSLQGIGRKARLFGEYHHGYGEGQFFKEHTSWMSAGLSYGF